MKRIRSDIPIHLALIAIAAMTLLPFVFVINNSMRRTSEQYHSFFGLPSALTALTDRVSARTGIRIEKRFASPCPEMTPGGELVCYRIAQAAVTNALRHADASTIHVELGATDGTAMLTVADDGTGLDGAAPGSGIQGMRERALMIGADFEIESSDGAGTKVILRFPEAKSAI